MLGIYSLDTTDCTPSDQGMFTVQLVNSGEVWVSVQLHCLNGMMTFYLEPKSTLSVSAVFNEWLNPEQVYPDNSCAFEVGCAFLLVNTAQLHFIFLNEFYRSQKNKYSC